MVASDDDDEIRKMEDEVEVLWKNVETAHEAVEKVFETYRNTQHAVAIEKAHAELDAIHAKIQRQEMDIHGLLNQVRDYTIAASQYGIIMELIEDRRKHGLADYDDHFQPHLIYASNGDSYDVLQVRRDISLKGIVEARAKLNDVYVVMAKLQEEKKEAAKRYEVTKIDIESRKLPGHEMLAVIEAHRATIDAIDKKYSEVTNRLSSKSKSEEVN